MTVKAKTKSGCQRTEVETTEEVEITEEISKLLEGFSEEIETGIIATGRPPEAGSHSIDDPKGAYQTALIEGTIAGEGRAGPWR
ncbi:MAG: hypothetical protein IT345_07765 [Trueperaceae bacterium]|nr:hypothetical protein [Trueperaceae bacterium]